MDHRDGRLGFVLRPRARVRRATMRHERCGGSDPGLGIEGGYSVLINELTKVLTFDGNYINMRHIGLLAETMCFYGWLRPVSRHGFARVSAPMLKQASFEQPLEVLTDAALWHVQDKMKDVTSAVMFGKPIDVGTGTVRLLAEKKKQEKKPPMPEVPFVGKRRKRKRRSGCTGTF